MKKKSDLPVKICMTCGRPFSWRKKWEKVWDQVKYCSDRCRGAYGMLNRQIEIADAAGKEGIRSIARRVMSLANIYDHLLGHGLVQTIDFSAYLKSLCISLQSFQEKGEFEITLVCEAEHMELDLDIVTALGIIVTEVTSNAYLHAFPKGPGTIKVLLNCKEGSGILTISDDGIGFVPDAESKRHGTSLIKRLIGQAKGTAELKSDQGTVWTFIFPLEAKCSN